MSASKGTTTSSVFSVSFVSTFVLQMDTWGRLCCLAGFKWVLSVWLRIQRGSNIPKELEFRAFMVLTLSCPVLPHLPFNSSHVSILQGLPDLCTSSKLLVIPYKVLMSTFRVLSLFPETWTLTVHCCQKSHQNLSINVPELAHGAQKLFIQ